MNKCRQNNRSINAGHENVKAHTFQMWNNDKCRLAYNALEQICTCFEKVDVIGLKRKK